MSRVGRQVYSSPPSPASCPPVLTFYQTPAPTTICTAKYWLGRYHRPRNATTNGEILYFPPFLHANVLDSISTSRLENFGLYLAACAGLGHTPWLEISLAKQLNHITRPSPSVSTPNNDGKNPENRLVDSMVFNLWPSGSAVQTTPRLIHNDCHIQQPTDPGEHMPEVQIVEVDPQPEGFPRREGNPIEKFYSVSS